MLRLAPNLGNWLRQAHGKHERSEKNEKNQKNNTGQERHQHHTRSSTHGRDRRRRRSHGLRLVNRTTQQPASSEPSAEGEPELRLFRLPKLQRDDIHQKLRFSGRQSPNLLRER